MRHFLHLPCTVAGLPGGMPARTRRRFLVARTCFGHLAAASDRPARPTIELAAPARRANREIYRAKPAPEVVADNLESALQSHGRPGRKTLDKSPLSCGNPKWHPHCGGWSRPGVLCRQTARPGPAGTGTPKGAANCLNCKEIAGRAARRSESVCAVAQVPETLRFHSLARQRAPGVNARACSQSLRSCIAALNHARFAAWITRAVRRGRRKLPEFGGLGEPSTAR